MHLYNRGGSFLPLTCLVIPSSQCWKGMSVDTLEDVNVPAHGYHFMSSHLSPQLPSTAYFWSSDWQIIFVTVLLCKNSSHNSSVLDKALIPHHQDESAPCTPACTAQLLWRQCLRASLRHKQYRKPVSPIRNRGGDLWDKKHNWKAVSGS